MSCSVKTRCNHTLKVGLNRENVSQSQAQAAIQCLLFIEVANVAPAAFTVLQIAHQMFREAFHIWNTLNSFRDIFLLGLNQDFTFRWKHSSILSIVTLPGRNPGSCSCSSINHPSWEDGDLNSDWSILPILDSDWLWQWQCCGIESFYRWECHHFISTVAKEHFNPDQWEARVVSSQPIRGLQWALSGSGGLNTSSSWLRQNRNKSRHSFFPPIITLGHTRQWSLIWHLVICFRYHTMLHLIHNVCSETENQ